jgi:two-component system chemotaxis response regulator CheY
MRVMIVDDSAVMRKIVESALRHAGFTLTEVLQASNGAEALAQIEQAREHSPPLDLILCDVHMPVMNGLAFLREKSARGLAPGVPVTMITVDPSDPHLLQALAVGAAGYIAKPFTLAQILACVTPGLTQASLVPRHTAA